MLLDRMHRQLVPVTRPPVIFSVNSRILTVSSRASLLKMRVPAPSTPCRATAGRALVARTSRRTRGSYAGGGRLQPRRVHEHSRCQVLLLHSVLRAGAVFLVLCAQCCCVLWTCCPTWQSTSSKREKHSQQRSRLLASITRANRSSTVHRLECLRIDCCFL